MNSKIGMGIALILIAGFLSTSMTSVSAVERDWMNTDTDYNVSGTYGGSGHMYLLTKYMRVNASDILTFNWKAGSTTSAWYVEIDTNIPVSSYTNFTDIFVPPSGYYAYGIGWAGSSLKSASITIGGDDIVKVLVYIDNSGISQQTVNITIDSNNLMEKKLNQMNNTINQMNNTINNLTADLTNLRDNITNIWANITNLYSKIANINTSINIITQNILNLEKLIDSINASIATMNNSIVFLESFDAYINSSINLLSKQIELLNLTEIYDVDHLTQDITNIQNQMAKMNVTMPNYTAPNYTSEFDNITMNISSLNSTLVDRANAINNLTTEIAKLSNENSILKEKIAGINSTVSNSTINNTVNNTKIIKEGDNDAVIGAGVGATAGIAAGVAGAVALRRKEFTP